MSEKKLKLFVSSPGDLVPERQAVQRVVARINGDYLGVVHFEVIRWEEKSYSARAGFQSQIVEATSCDLVIAMLYQRMGTPLPVEVAQRNDGSAFESGTAYEIETSLLHAQKHGAPQLYMFRKTANAALLGPARCYRRRKRRMQVWMRAQAALPHLPSELVAGFSDSGEARYRPVPLPEAISKATAPQTPAP